MLFCKHKTNFKLLPDLLLNRMTKTTSYGAISSNWIIPTLSLIPTKKSHTRFVLLTHSMVSDIASLVVA